jgi:hypothetical protein
MTHSTVKDHNWWVEKFSQAGYGVCQFKNGKVSLQVVDEHIRAFLTKEY